MVPTVVATEPNAEPEMEMVRNEDYTGGGACYTAA